MAGPIKAAPGVIVVFAAVDLPAPRTLYLVDVVDTADR